MEEAPDSEKWTREVLIDDIVGNLGYHQGMYEVACLETSGLGPFDTLIRIMPWPECGEVVRFAMKTYFTSEGAEAFDKRFEDNHEPGAPCITPDAPAPNTVVVPYPAKLSLGGVTP